MGPEVRELDLLVIPDTCTIVRFEDVEGDPDGTGPYLYPVDEVDPDAVQAALREGATVKRGYEVPYAGDPKTPIGDFCGYRRFRRAYTLDRGTAETLAELAEKDRVSGDWPLFRGDRVRAAGYVSDDTAPNVTVSYGYSPRKLASAHLQGDEVRHAHEFDWGYGGSGPAELARAVLVAVYPTSALVRNPRCYQMFKRQMIARLPHKEFRLTGAEVRQWFSEWLKRETRQKPMRSL